MEAALSESSAPTSAYKELFDYLQQMEFRRSLVHALWGERVMGMCEFDHLRQSPEVARYVTGEGTPELERLYAGPMGRKWLNLDQSIYLRLMSKAIAERSKPWRDRRQVKNIQEQEIHRIPEYCIMTAILMPVFTRSVAKRDVIIAEVGLAQAALALKA